ncbi:MAG TPA: helix-turn-helix domain-containing protein [Pseudonocardiaceae bacterium]
MSTAPPMTPPAAVTAVPHRPRVRILLDTGPTPEEVGDIWSWFDAHGMDAECEGHSYGGPPITSAFLMVVNAALAPFLDRFAPRGVDQGDGAGEGGGAAAFRALIGRLHALRADVGRWGRPHGVKLEDSHAGHTVWLPPDLPAEAYEALLTVDVSGFDRDVPMVQLEWSAALGCWQSALTTQPRRLARRAPLRRHGVDNPRCRDLDEAEVGALWQLAGQGDTPSVVTLQRARVVLWSALGWNVVSIGQRTLMSRERVRAIIRNFNADGFDCLGLGYAGGEPAKPTSEEQRDAEQVAANPPSRYGVAADRWDAVTLAEFLVGEGVVEDVHPDWLATLLG